MSNNNIDMGNNTLMGKLSTAILSKPGIKRSELLRLNQHIPAREINATLATMEKGGTVYRTKKVYVGGGRTAEVWYPRGTIA